MDFLSRLCKQGAPVRSRSRPPFLLGKSQVFFLHGLRCYRRATLRINLTRGIQLVFLVLPQQSPLGSLLDLQAVRAIAERRPGFKLPNGILKSVELKTPDASVFPCFQNSLSRYESPRSGEGFRNLVVKRMQRTVTE